MIDFRCKDCENKDPLKIFAATCCQNMAIYVASLTQNEDAENVRLGDIRMLWQLENAEDIGSILKYP
jgi:hypothetical protein